MNDAHCQAAHTSRNTRSRRPARPKALGVALAVGIGMLLLSAPAFANGPQGKDLGLGIVLGDPTGLTLKGWLGSDNAISGHLAYDFDAEALGLYVDYHFVFDAFNIRSSTIDLPLYVGIGGKLFAWDDNCDEERNRGRCNDDSDFALGVRIPVGLALLLKKAPLEFFAELAVGLRVFPSTDGDIDAALGARFYF